MDFIKSFFKKISNKTQPKTTSSYITVKRNPINEINTTNHDFDPKNSIFLHSEINKTNPALLSSLEQNLCASIRPVLKTLSTHFNVQHILARFDRISPTCVSHTFDIILCDEINLINSKNVIIRENTLLVEFLKEYAVSKPCIKGHNDKSSMVITLSLDQLKIISDRLEKLENASRILKDSQEKIEPALIEAPSRRIGGLLV